MAGPARRLHRRSALAFRQLDRLLIWCTAHLSAGEERSGHSNGQESRCKPKESARPHNGPSSKSKINLPGCAPFPEAAQKARTGQKF
jgi:hypothetical protein